jgi:hypothetical protein
MISNNQYLIEFSISSFISGFLVMLPLLKVAIPEVISFFFAMIVSQSITISHSFARTSKLSSSTTLTWDHNLIAQINCHCSTISLGSNSETILHAIKPAIWIIRN